MINLQNFINIEETLKKEYRMTHNKYYVAFLEKNENKPVCAIY